MVILENNMLNIVVTILLRFNVFSPCRGREKLDNYFHNEACSIKKNIARVDIPQPNNAVEALHKKFKNEFLRDKRFVSHDALHKGLPKLIEAYNNQCHDSLFGLTPLEVWNGLPPDKYQYKTMLIQACHKRKLANSEFNCCTILRTL